MQPRGEESLATTVTIAAEGLNFDYLPGGPNTPSPVTVISAGEATMGDSDWLPFLDAVAQGNDFIVIASLFPILPVGVISLPRAPVRRPEDLSGKRFLVQGPTERAMLDALFRINGLKEDYRAVPVGFSPEPLLEGAGDAYFCFITNQPQTEAHTSCKEMTSAALATPSVVATAEMSSKRYVATTPTAMSVSK